VKPLEDFEGQPSRSHGDLHPNRCFTAVVLYLCRPLASFEYVYHTSNPPFNPNPSFECLQPTLKA
ncbi:hypothetical protein CGCFRS4_v016147, partial [Colletotrichum fructicola]